MVHHGARRVLGGGGGGAKYFFFGAEMSTKDFEARKRHINRNFLVRLPLGRPRECPGDKPGSSLGQTHFVPGKNPGFLLILHRGSPVCPWDNPGDEGRPKKFMC